MREILFRGKRLDDCAWVYGYYIGPVGIDGSHEICDIDDPSGTRYDVEPDTVGQYTGLTDKNGTKIFEGDILLYKGPITQDKCVIGFGEYDPFGRVDGFVGFYLYWENDKEQYQRYANVAYWLKCTDCICVGNNHDNPELLNGGAEDD